MANSTHRPPEVLWAQRSDRIYLTIALPDAKHVSVNSEPEGLFSFSAVGAEGKPLKIDLELYGSIISQGSKINVGLRNISCTIQKEKKGWWKRLLKSEQRPPPYVKVDWNKWCDEDEEEADIPDSDDDYSGENEDDEDDDGLLYLPDLEKARGKLAG